MGFLGCFDLIFEGFSMGSFGDFDRIFGDFYEIFWGVLTQFLGFIPSRAPWFFRGVSLGSPSGVSGCPHPNSGLSLGSPLRELWGQGLTPDLGFFWGLP